MASLWELWTEVGESAESLADPVLLECLHAGQNQRIFDDLTDDNLKSVLSLINGLLNNPKTREKGNTIFNQLVLSVNVTRFVGYQDTVNSTLHLVCKNLGSHNAQSALANFLPKVRELPDVNQTVVSSIVSKIKTFCVEELMNYEDRQPTVETVRLLKTCLSTFRGPCGPFRDRLEKVLVPFLDHENTELVKLICELFPLMSGSGGGGGNAEKDKHSSEWSMMVDRLLKTAYDTLYQLYCDVCPTLEEENPFRKGLSELNLQGILHPKVFLRSTLLKRRLINIISTICSYLRMPYPAAKPVGVGNCLKMVSYLVAANPVSLQNSSRKEFVFLSAILPSIHISAFELLNSLISSLGSNLLPESVKIENIFAQQWKWIDSRKKSFENVKLALFSSLLKWLRITCGEITNPKTYKDWIDFLIRDIRLEKEQVELKLLPKSKKEKKQAKTQALAVLTHNPSAGFLVKSPAICKSALILLQTLIGGTRRNSPSYKAIFLTVSDVHLQVYQSTSYPCPYDNEECRLELQKSILELAVNPYTQDGYGIPVGLIEALLLKGANDPVKKISVYCQNQLSILERLIHPMCASLEFLVADLNSHREADLQTQQMDNSSGVNDEEPEIQTVDAASQTDVIEDESTGSEDEDETVKKSDLNAITAEFRQLKSLLVSLQNSPQGRPTDYMPLSQSRIFSQVSANGYSQLHQNDNTNKSRPFTHENDQSKAKDLGEDDDDDVQFLAVSVAPKKVSPVNTDANGSAILAVEENLKSVENGISEEIFGMMQDFMDEDPQP